MESSVDFLRRCPLKEVWEKIGIRHHHGIALPVLGIHTSQSIGCGEYLDLIPLIDWVRSIGFDTIQILPINDTGVVPSPYSALSSCALHPIYLSLRELGCDQPNPFDMTDLVDYAGVLNWKMAWLKEYYKTFEPTRDYDAFCKRSHWLKPYALFRVLRDKCLQKPCQEWPHELRTVSHTQLYHLYERHAEEMNFYCMIQYLCDHQMRKVKTHADREGAFLMGDVPILISPDSVDVWHNPHLFDLDYSAGAPPDLFNAQGQYWGLPLYNWTAMEESDFSFWRQRLQCASQYYHIYRIDHAIGLFRIWAIHHGDPPSEGKFTPADEELALAQGQHNLEKIISHCDMLPIAEDLGVMAKECDPVIKSFGIPGTRILPYERDNQRHGAHIPPTEYNPINASSISTHDMRLVRAWWRDYPKLADMFCQAIGWEPGPLTLERQKKLLRLSHHTPTLFHINLLQEYFECIPDLRNEDVDAERINIPGKILPTNWVYRYRLPLEELAEHKALKEFMEEMC